MFSLCCLILEAGKVFESFYRIPEDNYHSFMTIFAKYLNKLY